MYKITSIYQTNLFFIHFKDPHFFLSVRFLMALLIFGANLIQYTQKVMVSIGIVCMVNYTWLGELNSFEARNSSINTCYLKNSSVSQVTHFYKI